MIDVTGQFRPRPPAGFFRQVVRGFLVTGATAALFEVDVIGGCNVTAAGPGLGDRRAGRRAAAPGRARAPGKDPPPVLTLAGIDPLLPGLTGLPRASNKLSVAGLADGQVTITPAPALAAGVTLGQFLTRPRATPLSPSDPVPRDDRSSR